MVKIQDTQAALASGSLLSNLINIDETDNGAEVLSARTGFRRRHRCMLKSIRPVVSSFMATNPLEQQPNYVSEDLHQYVRDF